MIKHLTSTLKLTVMGLIVCCLPCISVSAQPSIKINYSYLHSPELDKIFELYNFSRPWQNEALMPLTNGYGGSFGWNWMIQKSHEIHLLPEVSYSRFASVAENNGKELKAGFHQVNLGASLRIHPKSIFKQVQGAGPLGTRFFIMSGAGYNFFKPFVHSSATKAGSDDRKSEPERSFSPDLYIGTGFHFLRFGRFIVTAEARINWMPTVKLDQLTELVNGHNIIGLSNEASNVFMLNAGIRITMLRSQKNWWDRPREGDKT